MKQSNSVNQQTGSLKHFTVTLCYRYFQVFLKTKKHLKVLFLLLVILDGQRLKGTIPDTLCIRKNNQKGVAKTTLFRAKEEEGKRQIEENYIRLVHIIEVKQVLKLVILLPDYMRRPEALRTV